MLAALHARLVWGIRHDLCTTRYMPRPKSPEEREPRPSEPRGADEPAVEPPAPPAPLTPVDEKIGEPAGNLQDRADAFKRRHTTRES
jgi:hypothetical protein